MIVIPITAPDGKPHSWWYNFLYELKSDTILMDLSAEFAKWGAVLVSTTDIKEVNDSIGFYEEKDMTLFLLRYA